MTPAAFPPECLCLVIVIAGMYHHDVWQRADEGIKALVAVEIAADELGHLADAPTRYLRDAVGWHCRWQHRPERHWTDAPVAANDVYAVLGDEDGIPCPQQNWARSLG